MVPNTTAATPSSATARACRTVVEETATGTRVELPLEAWLDHPPLRALARALNEERAHPAPH